MNISADGIRPFLHLFLAGITAAIVYSALQTFLIDPATTAIGA